MISTHVSEPRQAHDVTDWFGERTLIRHAGSGRDDAAWRMFGVTGADRPLLLLTPGLTSIIEGDDIEDILFVRDDLAAIGWGIERRLQGALDVGISGYESYFKHLSDNPPQPRRQALGGPKVAYELATPVPDCWIPLVLSAPTSGRSCFGGGYSEDRAHGQP
jgi:hypothetical protein